MSKFKVGDILYINSDCVLFSWTIIRIVEINLDTEEYSYTRVLGCDRRNSFLKCEDAIDRIENNYHKIYNTNVYWYELNA